MLLGRGNEQSQGISNNHPDAHNDGDNDDNHGLPLRPHFLDVPGGLGPLDDPDHRLRIVRTPTESIHEVTREDERRRVGKRKRRATFKRWGTSKGKMSRGLSFSSSTSPTKDGRPGTGTSSFIAQGIKQVEQGLGEFGNQLQQSKNINTRTADQEEQAKAEHFHAPTEDAGASGGKTDEKAAEARRRRNVYLNVEPPMAELDKFGQPREYARNKVRTSKYTIWTFVPKNLGEQFRRVANLYFLGLVILQIFPIFGGASPVLAMLPLLAILCITAVKDGVEDYRRQQLDEAVNNSAVTRLGDWRNVNVPLYRRGFFAKLFGLKGASSAAINRSAQVSRGVRKLRAKEGDFNTDFLYEGGGQQSSIDLMHSDTSHANLGAGQHDALESTDALPEHGSTAVSVPMGGREGRSRSYSVSRSLATSHRTLPKTGVVDYDRQAPGTAKWERTLWKKLEVGDIVLLRENDQVPADIVVLSTSDADGQCFVETKNLDGETNLKPRKALKATLAIQHEEDVEHAQFVIDSEPPHANLYSYNGVLQYTSKADGPGREHPVIEGRQLGQAKEHKDAITINELLLRGCAIRNTQWIIGIVAYTGEDTKIMLNQGATPSKRSKIEKETNFNVIANFVILVGMCAACGIANGFYLASNSTSSDSYELGSSPASNNILNAVVTFGACLIVFQNIVPISLVITVELVKTIQAIFIYQDIEMWYEPLDHPCVPKTWNISDDLGQIEYIFSDKTGTLTQNVMEFKKCSIDGVAYGEGITEAMMGAAKRDGKDTSAFDPAADAASVERSKADMILRMNQMFKNRYLREDKLTFVAPKAIQDLGERNGKQRQNIIQFFRALAICHTVLGDRFDPDNQNLIEYKAESPDEAALVAAARDMGFVFLQRSNSEIEIEVMGQPERYQPLRVLEFNSSRKRMSVLVRQPGGRILMICKGADSVIYQRLKKDHDPVLKAATNKDMEDFANGGLRTLCIAYRYVTEEEFVAWASVYDTACAAVTDREDEIEKACEFIEHDLIILGATALEDKLQVGVPDAIAQLHRAGIKLWILTGDKVQTAIEIGFSCNLLTSAMDIMIISSDTEEGARTQIEKGLDKINKARADPSTAPKEGFAVVIDGETLRYALDAGLKPLFLEFTTQCSAVVCCRVSPSQKALTVRLVKEGKNAMTLAIGDGANDVAMIQEAHIGVGIAGLEGAQASMSADYAIGQFRYLTKLLLVHGRWCYIRVAQMHANFFYKNIVWVFAMFWYQFFCNFDGGYLFDYSLVLLYNLAFTSLPVIVLGAFDQDINAKISMAYPELYRRGIKGLEYSRSVFWIYMFDGLYQSAVCFFVPFLLYSDNTSPTSNGYDMSGQVDFGTTVAAAAVLCVTLFVGLNTTMWTALMLGVLAVSALLLYIWVAIYSAFPYSFNNLVVILYSTVDFWALVIIVQVIAIGPRFLYKYIQSNYFPIDNNIIREAAYITSANRHLADMERGQPEKYDSDVKERTKTPHLDLPSISQSPIMGRTASAAGHRTPSPLPPSATPPANVELRELNHHQSDHRGVPSFHSAQSPSHYQSARADVLEELGDQVFASPTSPTSPRSNDQLHPNDQFSPHSRFPSGSAYGISSPSPSDVRSFHSPMQSPHASPGRRNNNVSSFSTDGMRREGSIASFRTAQNDPYSEDEDDFAQGYAR